MQGEIGQGATQTQANGQVDGKEEVDISANPDGSLECNRDVAAITRGWAISLALGGASAAIFFGYALASTLTWNYPKTGLFMTAGFVIVGLFAGLIGVRRMFRQIGSAAQHSVCPTGGIHPAKRS